MKNQITSALEQVTMNGINLKTLNMSKISSLSEKNDLSSEIGLLKEYKRLGIQLKQLQILEKRYTDQLKTIKDDEQKIKDDIEKFSNLEVNFIVTTHKRMRDGEKQSTHELIDTCSRFLCPFESIALFFVYFIFFQILRSESTKKNEMLSSTLEELKHKKRVTEDVVDEAERRNDELRSQLNNNENYRQISHLEEKLSDLSDELNSLQKTYDEMRNVR